MAYSGSLERQSSKCKICEQSIQTGNNNLTTIYVAGKKGKTRSQPDDGKGRERTSIVECLFIVCL
jgi:hypothetical protein